MGEREEKFGMLRDYLITVGSWDLYKGTLRVEYLKKIREDIGRNCGDCKKKGSCEHQG